MKRHQRFSQLTFIFVTAVFGFFSLSGQADAVDREVRPIHEIFEPSGFHDPALYAKVAVIHWAPQKATPIGVTPQQAESYKQGNRDRLRGFILEAVRKNAEWIVTPELAVVGYPDFPDPSHDDFRGPEDIAPYVETIPGPSTRYFSKIAQQHHVMLQIGLAEVDASTGQFHNATVAIGPDGDVLARHRKMNLYGTESRYFVPGRQITAFESPIEGLGRIGLGICADIYSGRFLEGNRDAGITALGLSSSWAAYNTGMPYFRRGAMRMGAAVLASNHTYYPDAGVVDGDGEIQSHIRQSGGIAYGYLKRRQRW